MQLYLLEPTKLGKETVWEPWYNKIFGFVIQAASYKDARKLAADNSQDEGGGVWLNTNLTTCKKLTNCRKLAVKKKAKVIMQDLHAA